MSGFSERFWSKVDRGDENECWEWKSPKLDGGYGDISRNGTQYRAHREAFRMEKEDPGSMRVLHHCDNPACVNPNHLYLGTAQDNADDRVERGLEARGERVNSAKLTEDEVSSIKWELENTDKTQRKMADEYNIDPAQISRIKTGKDWTHVSTEER